MKIIVYNKSIGNDGNSKIKIIECLHFLIQNARALGGIPLESGLFTFDITTNSITFWLSPQQYKQAHCILSELVKKSTQKRCTYIYLFF